MPKLGGYSPFPLRMGGGRPRVEVLTNALAADRGDGFDGQNRETISYVIDHAAARALSAAWGTNQRLAQIWDPLRMGEAEVKRWERILALRPAPSDTLVARREVLAEVFARFGQSALQGDLEAQLVAACGDAFVAIEYTSYANAVIKVPDGTYPWGSVGSVPWSSSVAHVLVRMQLPTGWTEGEFRAVRGEANKILENTLPAWTTFFCYRPGEVSTPVAGGASAAGFYLDEARNLDNQVFRI